ncbi:hypothetical protein JL720_765 [Aureococcus anophagefferens]|nr:hypothetical protein JL720_765 [Aureococcus anophagefferens]
MIHQEESDAATRLQAISRGRRSRRVAARTATLRKEREHAATVLQNRQRGRLAAKKVGMQRDMSHASTSIGRVYRGRQARREQERKKRGGRALDRADMVKGLHTPGRGAFDLRHVFLGFTVSDRLITDLSLLEEYPHLQTINVSKNLLTDLRSLERVPYLTNLDASDNQLAEVLDLQFPECAPGSAWSTGASHVGSQLRVADLSRNRVRAIKDQSGHRYLEKLYLDGNRIRTISGVSGLAYLTTLSLNGNKIGKIDGLGSLPLKCVQLGSLDASDNAVERVREVERLADLPLFSSLFLRGNPCASLDFYKRRVIVRLQRLTALDDEPVTSEEKIKSINIHGGDESDVGHRKEMYKRYFGSDGAWENTLPPF